MSLKARKSKIYVFLAGAVVLGGLMFFNFGGRKLVARHEAFKMYFDSNVSGLVRGSRVTFKGVAIGYVDEVHLGAQQEPGEQRVPVVVKLDLDRLYRNLGVLDDLSDPAVRQSIYERGLRGELEVESYVTGKLYINLDYHRNPPPPAPEEMAEDVIPTMPSKAIERIKEIETTLQWVAKQNFAAEADKIANQIDEAALRVQVIPFAEFSRRIIRSLRPLSELDANGVHGEIGGVAAWMDNTNRSLEETNGQLLGQSAGFFRETASLGTNLASFSGVLGDVRGSLQPQSPWRLDFEQSLARLSEAMEKFTRQINALEAQPSFLYPPVYPPRDGSVEKTQP